ncbi:MAG: 4'-phosphopantetheinyl transferase superfamily protein [Bacteroidales bacterium]|nr:4'-phosphopantetheinyl transferase superfamily protein [Bacteroidales bacterium]
MVYLFDDIASFSSQDLAVALALVSGQRRDKALMFKFEKDQKLSVIAYLLLMHGLKREYSITSAQEFCYSEREKPSLKNYPEIHFNISHCPKAVACAIAAEPVGIDVEEMSHYSPDLSEYVHNASENKQIQSLERPQEEFCRLWTVKESILKITGIGLVDDTKDLIAKHKDLTIRSKVYPERGYAMSYALRSDKILLVVKVTELLNL